MNLIGILDDDIEFRQDQMVKAIASLGTEVKPICHDNVKDFLEWLAGALTSIRLLSLDHDLGPSRERNGERFEPGTGMEIVDFLVLNRPTFPIIVHSSNPLDGPTMVRRLEEAGWTVHRVIPFMDDWITAVWLKKVQDALDAQ
jgi:hypothetical protein